MLQFLFGVNHTTYGLDIAHFLYKYFQMDIASSLN